LLASKSSFPPNSTNRPCRLDTDSGRTHAEYLVLRPRRPRSCRFPHRIEGFGDVYSPSALPDLDPPRKAVPIVVGGVNGLSHPLPERARCRPGQEARSAPHHTNPRQSWDFPGTLPRRTGGERLSAWVRCFGSRQSYSASCNEPDSSRTTRPDGQSSYFMARGCPANVPYPLHAFVQERPGIAPA
jgi:hypothetical protein